MDGGGPGANRRLQHSLLIQVAPGCARGADDHHLVSLIQPAQVSVSGAGDSHTLNAQTATGAEHPNGDLASVGDKNPAEHQRS